MIAEHRVRTRAQALEQRARSGLTLADALKADRLSKEAAKQQPAAPSAPATASTPPQTAQEPQTPSEPPCDDCGAEAGATHFLDCHTRMY